MTAGKRRKVINKQNSNVLLATEITAVKHARPSEKKPTKRKAKTIEQRKSLVEQAEDSIDQSQVKKLVQTLKQLADNFNQLQKHTGEYDRLVQRLQKRVAQATAEQIPAVGVSAASIRQPEESSKTADKSFLDVLEGALELVTTPGMGDLLTGLISALAK